MLTHLIILHRAAGFGGMAQDDANYIIKTYVDMFMATNAQPPSVLAPYVAELPRHDQILCFASLFSRELLFICRGSTGVYRFLPG